MASARHDEDGFVPIAQPLRLLRAVFGPSSTSPSRFWVDHIMRRLGDNSIQASSCFSYKNCNTGGNVIVGLNLPNFFLIAFNGVIGWMALLPIANMVEVGVRGSNFTGAVSFDGIFTVSCCSDSVHLRIFK